MSNADDTVWTHPKPAVDRSLTDAQVDAWRSQGSVLVSDLFSDALIERVRQDATASFPPAGSVASRAITDFGSGGRLVFPAASDAINSLTLDPRLLAAAARLLDTEVVDLRLTQSDVWVKYGRDTSRDDGNGRSHDGPNGARDNDDQRMHVDYPNHTLTHPPSWHTPEAVEVIVYLSDVADCGGATAVVARSGDTDPAYAWPIVATPGVAGLEWVNDRRSAEAYLEEEAPDVASWRARNLYPREVHAHFQPGTVLLYRHDTWHRGTPLKPGTMRVVHNLTFRKATSEWISTLHAGWAWAMYRRSLPMEHLIANASVEQRCVLGFPAPGHAYWTPATVAAVRARFGPFGMDMAPYATSL